MTSLDGTIPFVRDSGRGPPVVLVHSAGSSSAQWRGLTESLRSRYRVLAPDLYGHGRTPAWPGDPAEPGRPFRLDDEARLLAAAIEGVPGPLHVVGHSYGGAACLQLALRRPQRVRSVVVFEPTLFRILRGTDREDAWDEVSRAAMGLVALTEAGRPSEGAKRFLDYLMGDGAWEAMPEDRQALLTSMMSETIVRECRAQMFDDSIRLSHYAALSMPVTVVVGTRSPRAMIAVGEVLASALPSARLVRLSGADHMAPSSSPEATLDRVEAALEWARVDEAGVEGPRGTVVS